MYRKLFPVAWLLAALLLLVGCGSVSPPWALTWSPSQRSLQSNAPMSAFAASAYVQRPDGSNLRPAASTWLATGSSPALGLALTRLDTAGQYYTLGLVTIDPGSRWWTLTDSVTVTRPAAGEGLPSSQEERAAWTLPGGTYNSASSDVPDTPPGGSLQLWVSHSDQEFVVARLYSTLAPPAAAIAVTMAGQSGWQVTAGNFTVIALKLDHGIYSGLGSLLFASNAGLQQSQQLATAAAEDLNDLLPS